MPCGIFLACLASQTAAPAAAQVPPADPIKIGGVALSGSLRTRIESWDWFEGNANNAYTFPGYILRLSLRESRDAFDWQLEFAVPFLMGLPNDAIAPGAQGQLGFGPASAPAPNGACLPSCTAITATPLAS